MSAASGGIFAELCNVGASLLYGAAVAAVYDVWRIFRRVIPRGVFCVSVEDAVYWAAVGIGTCGFFLRVSSGELRGYLVAGIAIGALLYHILVGRWLIAGAARAVRKIKKELKKLRKAVTIKRKHT